MCGQHPQYAQRTESVSHPLLPGITNTRLDNFFWGPYASQHVDKLSTRSRLDDTAHVQMSYWSAPGDSKPGFDEAAVRLKESANLKPLRKGDKLGPSWTNHWVKVDLTFSDVHKGQPVIFEFDPCCEGLIYALDSTPIHGITGGPNSQKDGKPGTAEDRRIEHIVPPETVESGSYSFIIEVSCNGMFGLGGGGYRYQIPDSDRYFTLALADLIVPNMAVRGLRTDFRILAQLARSSELQVSSLPQRALKACDDIMNTFRRVDSSSQDQVIDNCRKIAWEVLGPLDSESLQQLSVWNDTPREAKVWAIGHCHIDTAWLWRYTQTQQKIARSWTTQCDLMDRWPNHQFAASSAQQYAWLEQLYPKGFGRVQHYVKEGRFLPVGGAWVEHDCMIPSGESLIRQYLYGQRYFRSRFGSYCREAWLPDTFGYASQLPQILRGVGLNYFFTQKLSWNNINVFPYSTFNWAGIDGTQVLAHMTPVDTYNAQCNVDELMKAMQNHKNRSVTDECLLLFGNGDGGGGPTPLMLEKLERLCSLSDRNPEVPSVKMGSPIEFFDQLCEKTKGGRTLPTWHGELYFELHRGTYTTQADLKRGNREMETLLRDLEYFATLASLRDKHYKYPKSAIDEMWQETLLAQFHDCLPGTTISHVVDDNRLIYETQGSRAKALIAGAIESLTVEANGDESLVIDPQRVRKSGVVQVPSGEAIWVDFADGKGMIRSQLDLLAPHVECVDGAWILENDRIRLTLSNGRISSLYDKNSSRELILPGAETGGLMIYEDYPLSYDAWDVEIYHLATASAIDFTEIESSANALTASLIATARFGQSVARLTFSVDATKTDPTASAMVRVDANIDWHERHKFLKFALPLDIHASSASYGTQFGIIQRPTHRNTTHDQAKFEVCAHGFGDLSEVGFGVAIASRHKYGYAVEGNTMRLSLLRAPTSPDPETDQGEHNFGFAILAHSGTLAESSVVTEAKSFSEDVYFVKGLSELPTFSLTGDRSRGIILETIKRGEDDEGSSRRSIVLRLYESLGGRAKGTLNISGLNVESARWANLLEDTVEEGLVPVTNPDSWGVPMDFRCFEIKTLILDIE